MTLVYVWIVFAMFWIGMPYTLRDQIAWLTQKRRPLAISGLRRDRLWSRCCLFCA